MRTFKIKEIATIVNGSTPSTSNPLYWNGDIVWLTPKDLTNYTHKYIFSGHANITKDGYESCSTTMLPRGTILLSSRAPIGYIAIAGREVCTNQGFKSLICKKNIVLNEYLYYWLSTKVEFLQSISNGATFKELSKETLGNVEIDLPTLVEQQHIVNTIGSVDDLIENYDCQITKLITLGDALLGRYESKENLSKYANILLGGTPSRKHEEYWNGSIKWINSGAITGQSCVFDQTQFITKLGVEKSAAKRAVTGDTVLSIIDPSINKVSLILDDNIYFNQSVICINPKNKLNCGYLYFATRELVNRIKGFATGAAQQSLNKEMFEISDIVCPDVEGQNLLNIYGLQIMNLYRKKINLQKQKKLLLDKYF